MLRHYLASALRNFRRNPLSTAIKLLALTLGLVCLLTAHAVGDYFRRADTHWAKADRILAIVQTNAVNGREEASLFVGAAWSAAEYLRTDFPELEAVARLSPGSNALIRAGDRSGDWRVSPADPDFLRIFDLSMISGDGQTGLDAPRTALILDDVARSLFGDQDAVGRTIDLGDGFEVTVTGVFSALPETSHMSQAGIYRFDILISLETSRARSAAIGNAIRPPDYEDWHNVFYSTYALLPGDGSLSRSAFNRRLADFSARRIPEHITARFEARPVSVLREMLFDRLSLGNSLGVSITTLLYLFGGLALAVACLDFANLATAEAARRSKEIGLRKTLGARQGQVAIQMIAETAILALVALAAVIPLTAVLLGSAQGYANMTIPLPQLARVDFWLGVLGIVAAVTLASAAYPSLVLAGIRPVFALRQSGLRGGAPVVRNALVALQFAVAAFLIVIIAVMLMQKAELRNDAVRPDEDPLLDINMDGQPLSVIEAFGAELLAHPAITGFAVGNSGPYSRQSGGGRPFTRSPDPLAANGVFVTGRANSYGYLTVAGATFLAGRDFTRDLDPQPDVTGPAGPIVIDAETARLFGFASPADAIGEQVYPFAAGPPPQVGPPYTIIGVIDRPPLQIVADGPPNFMYSLISADFARAPLVRISKDRVDDGIAHIERTWQRMFPGSTPQWTFLDVIFDGSFRLYSLLNVVFLALAGIAAAIAAMGLFGMASFVVQRRVREIGVRKTLGATTPRVLALLLWDFSKPVIVANLIAWPFAWMAAQAYLNQFVIRTPLTPWPFLGSLAASLLIAWLAVGVHAFRAARVKPAMVLKAE